MGIVFNQKASFLSAARGGTEGLGLGREREGSARQSCSKRVEDLEGGGSVSDL